MTEKVQPDIITVTIILRVSTVQALIVACWPNAEAQTVDFEIQQKWSKPSGR